MLQKYTFIVSAATHYGIDTWLNGIIPLLKNTRNEDVYHIPEDEIAHQKDEEMMITNISDEEKEMLIEE
ncbi:TPA: hypothetical protein DEP21_00385 [Patescibacteria group bacterium]|nr:hypothetical protein [Candidatus Gracilibacteria bacterium]